MCLTRLLASLWWHCRAIIVVSVHLRWLALTVSVISALTTSEVSSLWRHCRAVIVVSVHLRRLTLAISVTSALWTSEVSSLRWLSLTVSVIFALLAS